MTDSPIKPRANVSPTCRGSTGTRHNGWNPAPLVPPSRLGSQSDTLDHSLKLESNGVDIHGWNPDWSVQPTNSRTCGVAHALHRCIVPRPLARTCPTRPRRGLPDRPARRCRRSPDSLFTSPDRTVGRVWGRFRISNRRLGFLASSPASAGAEGATHPIAGSPRSGSYVRSGPQGRFAPRGGSLAPASGFGPRGRAGLVLLRRRGGGSAPSGGVARSARSRCSVGLPRCGSAPRGGGAAGGRSHGLRPVCSALLNTTRRPVRRFSNVASFPHFGGFRP